MGGMSREKYKKVKIILRNIREFDERFLLKSHPESYIITIQQDKKLSKKCLGGRAKGEIRTPCFCVENAPVVSRGGIIIHNKVNSTMFLIYL